MNQNMTPTEASDQLRIVCENLNRYRAAMRSDMTYDERDAAEDVIADLQDERDELIDFLRNEGWSLITDLDHSYNVVALINQLSSTEDPESDYESRTLYQVVRVVNLVNVEEEDLIRAIEGNLRTRGGCGHSHDCCGCVRWSCEATRISQWDDVYALRMNGIANI